MRSAALATASLLLASAACAHAQTAGGSGSSAPPSAGAIVDGDRELFPDPADRTRARMEAARHIIEDYRRTHGAYPRRLDDTLPRDPGERGPIDIEHDAWSRRFEYRRTGTGYELRSPGPDGVTRSPDDLVVSSDGTGDARISGATARSDAAEQCVVKDGVARLVLEDSEERAGETRYPRVVSRYIDQFEWFTANVPVVFRGRQFWREPGPRVLPPEFRVQVGSFQGVSVFALADDPAVEEGVIFLPLAPGCGFQSYYFHARDGDVRH